MLGSYELIIENLLEKLTLQRNPKRLLITDNRLMGSKIRPFNGSLRSFYNQLKMLFEGHSLRLFVETRNPATFIASAYSEAILTSIDKNFRNYPGTKYANFLLRKQHLDLTGHNFAVFDPVWVSF